MTARAPGDLASAPAEGLYRRGALALALQETLTATVRLRANRQSATDGDSFRAHVKQLLSQDHEVLGRRTRRAWAICSSMRSSAMGK